MAEEINLLVTDAIADVVRTPPPDADERLIAEGVDPGWIDFVGSIMIDVYEMRRPALEASDARRRLGLEPQAMALSRGTDRRPSAMPRRAANSSASSGS